MGRRKKGVYERRAFETKKPGPSDVSKEPYSSLYATMITSDAWHNLTHGARSVYTYMKLQYQSKANKDLKPLQFYFNRSMYVRYGFKNSNQVDKWIQELVCNGFIKIIVSGKNTRTRNIYGFSSDWQNVALKEKNQNAGTKKRIKNEERRRNGDVPL